MVVTLLFVLILSSSTHSLAYYLHRLSVSTTSMNIQVWTLVDSPHFNFSTQSVREDGASPVDNVGFAKPPRSNRSFEPFLTCIGAPVSKCEHRPAKIRPGSVSSSRLLAQTGRSDILPSGCVASQGYASSPDLIYFDAPQLSLLPNHSPPHDLLILSSRRLLGMQSETKQNKASKQATAHALSLHLTL